MSWVICPQCWDSWQGRVGALCSACSVPAVSTPLFPREAVRTAYTSLEPGFFWLSQTKGIDLICPECQTKISTKHYDPEFEWYECPKCEGSFTADELEEAENGTSPRKRAELAAKRNLKRATVVAKGKQRRTEIAKDEEAVQKLDKEMLKPRKAKDPQVPKHKDRVPTNEILNIVADEIETIGQELGVQIDRTNAREFYAMNLVRPLLLNGISAREKDVPMVKCSEHAD